MLKPPTATPSASGSATPGRFAKGVVIAALALANMQLNDTDLPLAAIQASTITSALAKAPDH